MSKDLQPALHRLHETSVTLLELSPAGIGTSNFFLRGVHFKYRDEFHHSKIYFMASRKEGFNLWLIGLNPETSGLSLEIEPQADQTIQALLRPQIGNWRKQLADLEHFYFGPEMLTRLQAGVDQLLIDQVLKMRKGIRMRSFLQAVSD